MDELGQLLALPPPVTQDEADQWMRAERKTALIERWMDGDPPRRRFAALENPAWRAEVSPLLIAWASQWTGKRSALLIGPTGCGKSSAALAALRRLYATEERTGERVAPGFVWASERALCEAERHSKLGAVPELLWRTRRAAVTVVDEVGRGGRDLFDLVDSRYESGRPTVVCSALTPAVIVERYGSALWRRMVELGDVVDCHRGGDNG